MSGTCYEIVGVMEYAPCFSTKPNVFVSLKNMESQDEDHFLICE